MAEHVIIIEHTPDELVREFSINEPLDCAPSVWLRLRMRFSRRARSDQHFRESGYLHPFFCIPGTKWPRIVDGKLVIEIKQTSSWDDVQPVVIQCIRESQYWHYNDAIRIKSRAPSV